MNYRSTRDCVICNRPSCGTEHLTTDITPAAMAELLYRLDVIFAPCDPKVACEVTNFVNLLRSSLQHWEPAPDNFDLLG